MVTLYKAPPTDSRQKLADAKRIKSKIEDYWRGKKEYGVMVSMDWNPRRKWFEHRSNLVNGMPRKYGATKGSASTPNK